MNNGWISIHRKILDDEEWLSEPFTRSQAWIDVLLIANHKSNSFYVRGNLINVSRGQFAYGETELAKRWKWSRDKVRRFLHVLETRQQIIQQKSRVLSIYTVVNYEMYQQNNTTDETTEKQQKNINNNNIYTNIPKGILGSEAPVRPDKRNPDIQEGVALLRELGGGSVVKETLNRYALKRLFLVHGKEKVLRVLEYAWKLHGHEYAPQIYSYMDLEKKWEMLKTYAQKQKAANPPLQENQIYTKIVGTEVVRFKIIQGKEVRL